MRAVELSLSMFDSCSTVSSINRRETDIVDRMFTDVFKCSQRISKLSGGCFDPTIAPLVNLWGFGHGRISVRPDSASVSKALSQVGINRCNIVDNRLIIPEGSNMNFDFSAIAKGYGVDCVARMLAQNGCENYMVEIGGEISVHGHNPEGKPWRIQIDAPITDEYDASAHHRLTVIELNSGALATSGNYRNYIDLEDGLRIGHTISPLSGYPISTTTLSVSITAPDCMTADALATACMVMPRSEAFAMIENLPDVEGLFVISTPKGDMTLLPTSGWGSR